MGNVAYEHGSANTSFAIPERCGRGNVSFDDEGNEICCKKYVEGDRCRHAYDIRCGRDFLVSHERKGDAQYAEEKHPRENLSCLHLFVKKVLRQCRNEHKECSRGNAKGNGVMPYWEKVRVNGCPRVCPNGACDECYRAYLENGEPACFSTCCWRMGGSSHASAFFSEL